MGALLASLSVASGYETPRHWYSRCLAAEPDEFFENGSSRNGNGNENRNGATKEQRIHARRAARGHCDYWRACRGALAGRADGARGWATTDNPYEIGQRIAWDVAFGPIPGTLAINNSNEWGHCFYSFHTNGANFAFTDGSVRVLNENLSLLTLIRLVTRAGRETTTE